MYGETAANAERRVAELLVAGGASPGEIHTLIATIQAGAVEGAHREVIELDTRAPSGSGDQVHEDWLRAVEAIASTLPHIADRTVRHAESRPLPSRHRRSRRARRLRVPCPRPA